METVTVNVLVSSLEQTVELHLAREVLEE